MQPRHDHIPKLYLPRHIPINCIREFAAEENKNREAKELQEKIIITLLKLESMLFLRIWVEYPPTPPPPAPTVCVAAATSGIISVAPTTTPLLLLGLWWLLL